MRKTSEVLKTSIFPWFFACRKLFAQVQKRRKIARGACPTELPTKIALKTRLGTRWARFWRVLVLSWAALGRHLAGFWALLDASWPFLGAFWPPLRLFLGALGRTFGVSTSPWIAQDAPRSILGRFSGYFLRWIVLTASICLQTKAPMLSFSMCLLRSSCNDQSASTPHASSLVYI